MKKRNTKLSEQLQYPMEPSLVALNTFIHDLSLSWIGICTSIISGKVSFMEQ
jgi:hypothetical protein